MDGNVGEPNTVVDDVTDGFGVRAVAVRNHRQAVDVTAAAGSRTGSEVAEFQRLAGGFVGFKEVGLFAIEVERHGQ